MTILYVRPISIGSAERIESRVGAGKRTKLRWDEYIQNNDEEFDPGSG